MNRETDVKKWLELLRKYYSTSSIRRMYRRYDGSEHELAKHYSQLVVTKNNTLRRKITHRKMKQLGYALGVGKYAEPSYKQLPKYKNRRAKKKAGVVTIYMDEVKFNKFFTEELKLYLQFDRFIGSDLSKLETILKTYHDEIIKIRQIEALIKKDSIEDREKSIKEALNRANEILRILNSNLYNSLPKEVNIKTIGELNKETEKKLKALNLTPTASYAELLKSLRNI